MNTFSQRSNFHGLHPPDTQKYHFHTTGPCTKSIRSDHKQNNQLMYSSLQVHTPQCSRFRTSLISHFNISFSNSWPAAIQISSHPLSTQSSYGRTPSCITVRGTDRITKWILLSLKNLLFLFKIIPTLCFCSFITDFFFKSLEPNEVFYNEKFPVVMLFLLAPIHPTY